MTLPKFEDILEELDAIRKSKGADYGSDGDPLADLRSSEQFGVEPWLNTILRINQKMHRLMSYARKGQLENEGVDDTIKDMAVYAIHALRLYREYHEKT